MRFTPLPCRSLGLLAALPAEARSPREAMFPGDSACSLRQYSASNLTGHPDQLGTQIALGPLYGVSSDQRMLVLKLQISLRGRQDYLEGAAYCENEAGHLFCGMEGDAGIFTLKPAKNGTIRPNVGRYGLSFESMSGFVTLPGIKGDDRSFLLPRVPADACP